MDILDKVIGVKEASKITGLAEGTIKNYCASGDIKAKKIGKTWVIDRIKLEESMEMKQTYEDIMKVFIENEKVFVNRYDNVNDLLSDGMDKEILDENYYVYGSIDVKPSQLQEPFIIIEVEGSVDTPIFTADRKEDLIHYLEDNYGEYIIEGN